jgi:hypothetical protein
VDNAFRLFRQLIYFPSRLVSTWTYWTNNLTKGLDSSTIPMSAMYFFTSISEKALKNKWWVNECSIVPIPKMNCLKDCFICKRSSEKGKFVNLTLSPSIHQTPEALTKWGHMFIGGALLIPSPEPFSIVFMSPLPLILKPKEFASFSPVWLQQPLELVGQHLCY